MQKCPVCGNTNEDLLCKTCSFDGSTDYAHHPTLASINIPKTLGTSTTKKQPFQTKFVDVLVVFIVAALWFFDGGTSFWLVGYLIIFLGCTEAAVFLLTGDHWNNFTDLFALIVVFLSGLSLAVCSFRFWGSSRLIVPSFSLLILSSELLFIGRKSGGFSYLIATITVLALNIFYLLYLL